MSKITNALRSASMCCRKGWQFPSQRSFLRAMDARYSGSECPKSIILDANERLHPVDSVEKLKTFAPNDLE
jgi:hypothetical protein